MDRVDVRLFVDLDRLLVLDPDFHFSGRFHFFTIIDKLDVVEPGKRQHRVLIILVLQAAQGFLVISLISFRIALFGDLFCSERSADREFRIRINFRIYSIAVIDSVFVLVLDTVFIFLVYIFIGKLRLLRDQLYFFSGLRLRQ